jgi:hypothetical protein
LSEKGFFGRKNIFKQTLLSKFFIDFLGGISRFSLQSALPMVTPISGPSAPADDFSLQSRPQVGQL